MSVLRHVAAALVAAALVTAAPTTHAAPPPALDPSTAKARASYAAGADAYARGDYAGAAAAFFAAYALEPDAGYLFNAAQAQRLAGDCAGAAATYRRFLTNVPRVDNRDDVEARIVEQQTCADQRAAARAAAEARRAEQRRARKIARLERWTGAAALGLGAVGLGVGTYYAFRVRAIEDDLDGLCRTGCAGWDAGLAQTEQRLYADGDRAETYMVLSYVTGGVLALGGGALLLWGRAAPNRDEATLTATPTAGGVALSMSGRF